MATEIIHCYGGERTTMTVINTDDRVEMSAGGTGELPGQLIMAGKTPLAARAAGGEGRVAIRELIDDRVLDLLVEHSRDEAGGAAVDRYRLDAG